MCVRKRAQQLKLNAINVHRETQRCLWYFHLFMNERKSRKMKKKEKWSCQRKLEKKRLYERAIEHSSRVRTQISCTASCYYFWFLIIIVLYILCTIAIAIATANTDPYPCACDGCGSLLLKLTYTCFLPPSLHLYLSLLSQAIVILLISHANAFLSFWNLCNYFCIFIAIRFDHHHHQRYHHHRHHHHTGSSNSGILLQAIFSIRWPIVFQFALWCSDTDDAFIHWCRLYPFRASHMEWPKRLLHAHNIPMQHMQYMQTYPYLHARSHAHIPMSLLSPPYGLYCIHRPAAAATIELESLV